MQHAAPARIPRTPRISNRAEDWWRLCTMPNLGVLAGKEPGRQNIVDHGFIQAANGTWQLWACLRGTGVSRLIYGWEADALTDTHWRETGVRVRADAAFGEQANAGNETAGAPFFLKRGEAYYCLFHSNGFRLMTSTDGVNYVRDTPFEGSNLTSIPGGRDIMILKDGDRYISYATVTGPKDPTADPPFTRDQLTSWVVAAESTGFVTWTGERIVSKGGVAGSGPVDAESPFVVFIDGYYYLFRSSSITFLTYVYRSSDPFAFGIDDDSQLIAQFAIKAPELIHHDGTWYISDLHDFQGLRMTTVEWV